MFSTLTRVLPNVSLALGALSLCMAAHARDSSAQGSDDINVSVTRKGDVVRVGADFIVPVSAPQAFAVLTDYDHMRDFLPDVVEAKLSSDRPPGWWYPNLHE